MHGSPILLHLRAELKYLVLRLVRLNLYVRSVQVLLVKESSYFLVSLSYVRYKLLGAVFLCGATDELSISYHQSLLYYRNQGSTQRQYF